MADNERTKSLDVALVRLAHATGLALPTYATADSAGLDLVAAVDAERPVRLEPGCRVAVPTGLSLALPRGTEGQVRPRSGLALRHGVTVLNSPGTIDADYRGEIQVLLINHGEHAFEIRRGDRIGQLVIAPILQARLLEQTQLPQTARGEGGFGSTGTGSGAGTGTID